MNKYEEVNISRLRPYLADCAVLLKYNGAFPLREPCRLEAVGAGVRYTVKGGTGSGEVNSRYFVNIEDGLESAGFHLVNKLWPEEYAEVEAAAREQFYGDVRRTARRNGLNIIQASMGAVMKQPDYRIPLDCGADAAIYVVSRISGEGNDRIPDKGDFRLTDSEVRDILALDAAYERFMLVINAGGPVDLTPVLGVGNILVLSQLGVETGNALADILLGKRCPSGRLATTWSRYEAYCRLGEFGLIDDVKYREGIYVGYRWFDASGAAPLFPFGYGLGYTTFRMDTVSVAAEGSKIAVTVRVENTGGYKGKEVAQVYLSCPAGRLDKEVKSLAGFAKTRELAPGESEDLTVRFDLCDFASYDAATPGYLLEAGQYIVLVGNNSRDVVPAGVFELAEDVVVRRTSNLFGEIPFADYRNHRARAYDLTGLPVQTLAFDMPAPVKRAGNPSHNVLNTLSDKELALLNIGGFDPRGGISSIIGDSAMSVAGAAGQSTYRLKDKGIRSIILADGPAGVRLSREYYEDKHGAHAIGPVLPESMTEMLPKPVKKVLSRTPRQRKGVIIKEQYTTAIPIATAIAQSFDLSFAELCGDIVGGEMQIFGVDLWLAPALNIHRNVLCGRNFEYYSEDPVVSGQVAAAISRGVQRHRGCGVTIKHYAANNQETNRYANNSLVSERALREIYLKGFGICVRDADPMAVMTSYNLQNGTHTSESAALTEILREEFGFDGLIMTDWVVGGNLLLYKDSKYGVPNTARVAAAGCSLFMPGRKGDYQQLLEGLGDGTVTRDQLIQNAEWLLHVIDRLNG
ncbi:MAG: glycoside hydrolase family 3 C-terminal domain-containing protein [Mogibacterium sp.]|nr:glycoside hydrolase family 3 C-terminal domain-containing protein [Mogibacterium sp.]